MKRIDTIKIRNSKIKVRFEELYNKKRMRFDDVFKTLAGEFFLGEETIRRILKKYN